MFREQQSRPRPASAGGQQRGGRVPIFGLPNQNHNLDLDLDDREEDELIRLGREEEADSVQSLEEDEDWRRAAQMLTERDERRLLNSRQPRSSDVLDMVAPINRRLQQANQRARRSPLTPTESPQTPGASSQQQQRRQQQQVPSSQKLAQRMVFTSHKQIGSAASAGKTTEVKKTKQQKQSRANEQERRKLHNAQASYDHDDDEDDGDNSSLSFAQSGCHSILSAWRIKAANKAARLAANSRASSASQFGAAAQGQQPKSSRAHERPASVLSQASSVGKKSAASTAYTARSSRLPAAQIARIPLGPKSAQHFVTNTRRRRRANELIMNTLEARRRALSLNRSNLASSLFGSESYLGAGHPSVALDDYQRLSMSPSPLGPQQPLPPVNHARAHQSPSPFGPVSPTRRPAGGAGALSDLGAGRQSPATQAQLNKLLAAARNQPSQQVSSATRPGGMSGNKKTLSHSSLGGGRPPPLAKLDQNSSDLCSSNDSSSGRDDDDDDEGDEDDSDGSQFTQLVTSELTPSCLLLLEQSAPLTGGRRQVVAQQPPANAARQQRVQSPVARPQVPPPRPPERTKRKQVESKSQEAQPKSQTKQTQQQQQQQQQVSTSEEDDKSGNKLRRGALKRDSIRRLRLSRQQRSAESDEQYATKSQLTARISSRSPSFDTYELRKQQQQQEREQEAEQEANRNLRPLSKARKLDIENNPFLNRHHFRTLSTRSTDSKQSYASHQQVAAASRCSPLAAATQSPVEDKLDTPTAFRRDRSTSASARASGEPRGPSHLGTYAGTFSMPKVDMENVRQVERILRNMKPNEVIKSSSRELSTGRSQQVGARHETNLSAGDSGQRPEVGETERPEENVFKTTTRLVRAEGARSSDDVKFDLAGNRQQRQLEERWRHERTVPMRLADGSVFSEQKFLSDRIEVLRGHSTTTPPGLRNISPPAGFSDTRPPVGHHEERNVKSSRPPGGGASSLSSPQKFVPTLAPKPSDRFGARPQVDEQRFSSPPPPPKPSRARSEEKLKPRQLNSYNAEQRQSGRPPVVPRASKSTSQSSSIGKPIDELPKPLVIDTAKVLQASLPKFERTADDEFRKRVDQLRQMARANLEASERRQAQEVRARRDKMKLVRPLSTNWSGTPGRPKSSTADEEPLTPRNLSQSFLSPKPPANSSPRQSVATDLDDMLLADRYQRPLRRTPSPTPVAQPPPVGAWRRSNSSLASLSGASRSQQATRPTSPAFGLPRRAQQPGSERAISPPSSVLSVEPRGDHSSATPMRVVVREKAAPRLDFAVVEQQPPVQHVRPVAAPPPATRQAAPAAQQQRQGAGLTVSQGSQRRPAGLSRSPEFGQAAASSNDDSAIASSVSSPSPLSSYVASQPQRPAGLGTPGASHKQHVVDQAQPTRATPTRSPVATTTSLDQPTPTSAGALPSILRRQQLETASGFSQASGRFTPTSPVGRKPTLPALIQQQQQHQQAPKRETEQPQAADQQRQMPPISQQHSLPAKRVHFNDRTSIRSFESISSEASHTTAIQQQQQQQHQHQHQHQSSNLDDLRRQVGSPDSMGSGSTSRLSNDSPAFGEFRRGGSGAAIYAIRGDPELEPMGQQQLPVAAQSPRQYQQVVAPQQTAQQFYPGPHQHQQPPVSHQTRPMMVMQSRVQYGQSPPRPATGGYNPSAIYQLQIQPPPTPPHQQQQQQQVSPLAGSIRMTAPPTIKTNPQGPPSSYQMMSPTSSGHAVHQQPPYMGRPQQPVVMVAPQQQQPQQQQRGPSSAGRPAHLVTEADEDDPDYALRLRQAATRRAFNYVQPQQISPQQPPPPLPPHTAGGGGGGGQVGVPGVRRQRTDLANFQTEV